MGGGGCSFTKWKYAAPSAVVTPWDNDKVLLLMLQLHIYIQGLF